MGKRGAEEEMNKDNYDLDHKDEGDENPVFKLASKAEINKRQIKQPKSRLGAGNSNATTAMAFSSPFTSIKTNTTGGSSSSPFPTSSSLATNASLSGPPSSSTVSFNNFPQKPLEPFANSIPAKENQDVDKFARSVVGLNKSFLGKIQSLVSRSSVVDLTALCNDYIKFRSKVLIPNEKTCSSAAATFTANNLSNTSSNGSQSRPLLSTSFTNTVSILPAPSQTTAAGTTTQTFNFGGPSSSLPSPAADISPVEPARTNPPTSQNPPGSVNISFGNSLNAPPAATPSQFSFGSTASAPKPSFSFGAPSIQSSSAPKPFSFSAPSKPLEPATAFSSEAPKQSIPFPFGENPKPPVSFGLDALKKPSPFNANGFSFKPIEPNLTEALNTESGDNAQGRDEEGFPADKQIDLASTDMDDSDQVLFQVKAKVFYKQEKEWIVVAVGELKVTKDKNDPKIMRLFMRSPNGKVLLNSRLFKTMIVKKSDDKNMSTFITHEGNLVPGLIRVKEPGDLDKLVETVQKCVTDLIQ